MVRQPAVAGKFYTGDPDRLRQELAEMMPQGETQKAMGVIAPHAGYVYSGKAAGKVYAAVQVPDTVLILGPNHTGAGVAAALAPETEWLTPLGSVPVNRRLSQLILEHAPLVREDAVAHRFEHSLEVQVPFLQYRNPRVSIAALCLALPDFPSISRIGEGIARAIAAYGDEVLIVASSDMTHYESAAAAKVKDDQALDRLTGMDPEGLLKVCREKNITMCGVIPATALLVAAKIMGATSCRLVHYTTSGEVNGDLHSVVAYAALMVC
ncbi:AmmeMemoRadiSam system protein B [Geomonas subterranea]|uniref:MEMO1 family protein KP001_04775 n=1 Tax=Geomonas subterranea TaxID=2847989 RepID=A0ABX8LNF1_9BACT|nr:MULTISPECIES: AmmeMemoRadiSam system protein B [Geomonas]QXE91854.1 AmmeMemoRadiSam system protein B [Geomonas subterranea]QXM10054.1 AmmeMemoRadiSam system protein B [Geomonas subterranea]